MNRKIVYRFDENGKIYREGEKRYTNPNKTKKSLTEKIYNGILTLGILTTLGLGAKYLNNLDTYINNTEKFRKTTITSETNKKENLEEKINKDYIIKHTSPRYLGEHNNINEQREIEIFDNEYIHIGIRDHELIRDANEIYNKIISNIENKTNKTIAEKNNENEKKKIIKPNKNSELNPRKSWNINKRLYEKRFSNLTQFDDLIEEAAQALGIKKNLIIAHASQESGGNIQAESKKGAVGLWQFIESTSRNYGIETNKFEDKRKDPVESNKAYIQFMNNNLSLFKGNIIYSLAAYNTGPANVLKAIGKAALEKEENNHKKEHLHKNRKLKDSYYIQIGKTLVEQNIFPSWKNIKKYLHPETRKYVPMILAQYKMLENSELIGLNIEQQELYTDIIKRAEKYVIKRGDYLLKIAREKGISVNDIKNINPQLNDPNYFLPGKTINIPATYD